MTKLIKKAFTVSVVVTTVLWAVGIAAFLPLGASASALEGDLIKMEGLSSVYYYAGGSRYVFPNESAYFSWYSDFSGVKTISQAELEAIPLGSNVVIRPGTKLVKITTDPKVYAVAPGGMLHHVDSEARATTLYGANWAQRVVDVPDAFFTNYTVGDAISSDMHPAGALIKYAGSDSMYLINAAGEKQMFSSMDAFNANRYKPSDVLTVSDTLVYPDGAAIGAGDKTLYDTSQGNLGEEGTGGGFLSVALASDTPAASSVPYSANNAMFTYVNLTAGAAPVTVTGLKATRIGLGTDANFDSVKLFVDGVQVGNSQSLNSSHQASFGNLEIEVPANSTQQVALAGTIAASGTAVAGHLVGLGIASAADVTTDAAVSGSFPVNGNQHTISSVTIGSVTLANGSLHPAAGNIDADAEDFRFTQAKVTAGSEDMKLSQVTAVRNGTAGDSDVENIELYDDTNGVSLGVVAGLTNGRAVFDGLDVTIPKGSSIELSVLADVVGGSGRTLAFDLSDGSAYLMMVEGQSYGFGVTPTGTLCTSVAGTCPAQTINQGYLTVAKSASTPATGNVAQGADDVVLAAFDYTVAGEPVQVTSTGLEVTTVTADVTDVTNIGIYDEDDNLVAGTRDGVTSGATITFSDAYTVPIGTSTYYVKANLAADIADGGTIVVEVVASTITAKGEQSNKTTYTTSSGSTVPPASQVTANTMTVQAGNLTVNTAATPIAGNVVVNAQDQVFAYFDLNATGGGEDVKITQFVIADTLGAGTDYSGVSNLELWGDPDNSDDVDEDVRLTTSNSTSTNAATVTFTFNTALRVSHLENSRLTLKGDVVSATGTSHTFDASSVTAVGWDTAETVSATPTGAGQAQTVQTVGTLKVEPSADRPAAAQFVAGTTGNAMMSYKFTAAYEDISVTTFYVATTSATSMSDIAKVKVYVDGTQVGAAGGYALDVNGETPINLAAGALTVPKDDYVTVSLKVDLADKTQLTDAATLEIGLGDDTADDLDGTGDSQWGADGAAAAGSYVMTATGLQSGQSLTTTNIDSVGDGSGNVSASYVQYLYDGVLTVSLNGSSPSNSSTAGGNKEVLRFDLTAVGDDLQVDEIEFCVGGTAASVTGTGDVTLKSGSTTYATMTQANFDTYWDDYGGNAANAGTYYPMDNTAPASGVTPCFSFGVTGATGVDVADGTEDSATLTVKAFTSTVEVAAGTTKTMSLYGDTTGATTNETLQITIGPNVTAAKATTSGLSWKKTSSGTTVDSALTQNLPVSGGSLVY